MKSPPSPMSLPCYTEAIAIQLVEIQTPRGAPISREYDTRVHEYLDLEAVEALEDASSVVSASAGSF